MPITTFRFLIFAFITILVFFIVPKKGQWIVLLSASLVFYGLNGIPNCIFILITAASTFFAARYIDQETERCKVWLKENKEILSREERKAHKDRSVKHRKTVLIVTMFLNFGLLCFFKYTNFFIKQVNVILHSSGQSEWDLLSLIVPLGISFYTFTTMGYLADVYWEKTPAQKNFFKLLLFTSFFPQIVQGPISDYRQLAPQLYAEHKFEYKNFKWGVQRFFWGLLKKLAIANVASVYIGCLFADYKSYAGISVFLGMLLYAVQIYADFSGYMDMVCGLCEIMGIQLAENFDHPYFSKSVSEYWRRWHITLGNWFKNYVYYAVGFSKWAQKIGQKGQKIFGNSFAKNMPGTIALIVVWFTTGLWHGANWGYIIWGLVNGIFIIATLWLEPFYGKMRQAFHIRETALPWRIFQIIRTFILMSFIKILPEVGGLKAGLGLWAQVFRNPVIPTDFQSLFPFVNENRLVYENELLNFFVMAGLIVIFFVFSLIQRKHPVRESFNKIPMVFRVLILAIVFVLAIEFGARSGSLNGAFMYEQF